MALRKCIASNDVSSMTPLSFYKAHCVEPDTTADSSMESDVDIDLQEVYFLIMHFLSAGPCRRTCGQFWNELLEHQLLPRRYHAWYSRSGAPSGDEDDNGISFPLGYNKLVERYPHIRKDHLVKLLKKLILSTAPPSHGMLGGNTPNAADVPTLLGSGSFSLLESDQMREDKNITRPLGYLRWPHMQADQVHGLSLREIGGGFSKHHRAPSIRAACYAIAKPSTMVQKMQIIKKLRGHQNAVYCAIFDRTGQYVITGSDDRLVKIWSMETAFCLSSCRGHEGDITDLAVSSNNALVASASNDCVIRVWRLPDGVPISVLRGHTGAVTAIAFSPSRAAIYQLLSSSDDGTCRIWDARISQSRPRIYIPKPPDTASGNINDPLPSTAQQGHQILCCAYNANGSVFVTGSSDTYARVWNAVKFHTEDSELPLHEMDVLSGHENDVNYVQFSGCAVPSRSSTADTSKEENFPKFKNNWFTHDNIVTCSRDGSAIIWIPRSRRSHGKVGKWTRAYHLKVPPPPMPPQPARGGPRQRNQPAPRGVNMIVWSLDNRFVLAAIMDCRICVWNAVDGSLVHSLTGHSESTYVLDVHPFNPRIAMSAGYDGKIIVWDIWEGTPVRTYETGHFKLVDGKFSPDGTSIVVSDEVGQIYILATGQGESQKDAKYDQFFLGDYRPLGQDEHGNVLDQETQLAPHRRNIQDLLCDSSMIPYPEPYQNMYQQRRLGALGIEWRPPSVRFAVGPGDTTQLQNYELVASFVDPTRWSNPLPEEFIEMNWEQENEVQSEDTDSEYNLTDEYTSEGEHDNLSVTSSGDLECSAEDSEADHASKEVLRRSKRKKHKREVEFTTSFGRRVKRRNLDDHTDTYPRINRKRKSRSGRFASKTKSSTLKSTRPRRLAAKNALNLFSRITGASTGGEDDGGSSMSGSSDSESLPLDSNIQSNESDRSTHFVKETIEDDYGITLEPSELSAPQTVNKRRLILKLAVRDSRKTHPSEFLERGESSSRAASRTANLDPTYSASQNMSLFTADDMAYGGIKIRDGDQVDIVEGHPNLSGGFKEINMKWGEVKTRTSKRLRQGDDHNHDKYNNATKTTVDGHVKLKDKNGSHSENQTLGDHQKERTFENGKCKEIAQEFEHGSIKMVAVLPNDYAASCNGNKNEAGSSECRARGEPRFYTSTDNNNVSILSCNNEADYFREGEENPEPTTGKFWIRSERIKNEPQGPSLEQDGIIDHEDWRMDRCDTASGSPSHAEHNFISKVVEDDGDVSGSNPDQRLGKLETQIDKSSGISNSKRFNAVYKRSRTYRAPTNSDVMDENASTGNGSPDLKMEFPETVDEVHQTRTRAMKAVNSEKPPLISNFRTRECQASAEASNSAERFAVNGRDQFLCEDWRSSSRNNLGLRSARNRRGYDRDSGSTMHWRKPHHSTRKSPSWLMLSEQEESCRYIPQLEDEVAYLRQGHQEYIDRGHTKDVPPWRNLKGTVRAVEFCRVVELDYQPYAGSGDSSCKLTFEFIGQSSSVFGESFNLTLVDLIDCSDFLVERTRYDAAIKRNWTHRDKCQVWWENDDREGGSWWDGRILAVKPKCSEFPDSPWERYVIQYKEDSKHHLHSPWELHEPKSFWDHPHIDDESREMLLSALDKIEHISSRNKDCYGFLKLKEVAQRSDFLNRFPVPLSSELIRRRLDNNYYRNLEAVKHDADVMLSNAKSFFARNAELTTKMRRLSDWFQHNFFSL